MLRMLRIPSLSLHRRKQKASKIRTKMRTHARAHTHCTHTHLHTHMVSELHTCNSLYFLQVVDVELELP